MSSETIGSSLAEDAVVKFFLESEEVMKLAVVKTEKTLGVCKKCAGLNNFLRITFKMPDGQMVALEICITCLLSLLDEA
jgi:hypothetical protein